MRAPSARRAVENAAGGTMTGGARGLTPNWGLFLSRSASFSAFIRRSRSSHLFASDPGEQNALWANFFLKACRGETRRLQS